MPKFYEIIHTDYMFLLLEENIKLSVLSWQCWSPSIVFDIHRG